MARPRLCRSVAIYLIGIRCKEKGNSWGDLTAFPGSRAIWTLERIGSRLSII
jgi:hypothetical protein